MLKLENLQPSGSFKSRGVGNYLLQHHAAAQQTNASSGNSVLSNGTSATKIHFFISSGGNAGLACVHAARTLSCPATVVVPLSTKPMMVTKLREAGAHEVIQYGATWKDADIHLRETAMPEAENGGVKAVYVPPFDHEMVWDGNSTLVNEVSEDLEKLEGARIAPAAVVCSVGGGGLFNGIYRGIERQDGWNDTKLVALETHGADSLNQSLAKGEHTTLPGITSLATSLGATRVSSKTYELATAGQKFGRVKSAVFSDAEAAMGSVELADKQNLLVEIACGINVAVCFGGRLEKIVGRKIGKEEIVVVVVCGGSAINVEMVREWRDKYVGALENGAE